MGANVLQTEAMFEAGQTTRAGLELLRRHTQPESFLAQGPAVDGDALMVHVL